MRPVPGRIVVAAVAGAVALVLPMLPALAAGGGGGAGDGRPAPPHDPPIETSDDGKVHGTQQGGGGGGDNDHNSVYGCSGYYPVSGAEVEAAWPTANDADRTGYITAPYIQLADYQSWQANPTAQWFRCDTGPPIFPVARAWYDYPNLITTPTLNFRDQLPKPAVTFSPPAGTMVVDLQTWPTLADYANVDIREPFPLYDFQARPQTLVWDPGDGSGEVRCPIPDPRPRPAARLGDACRHVYRRPSIDGDTNTFRSEVVVEYDIYTRIGGGAWNLTFDDYEGQTATVDVRVHELQAVAD